MLRVAAATCAIFAKRSGLGPVGLRMRRLGCGDSDTWGDGDSASESPHPSRGGNAEQRIGARRGGAGEGRPAPPRRALRPYAGGAPPAKCRTGTGMDDADSAGHLSWTRPLSREFR